MDKAQTQLYTHRNEDQVCWVYGIWEDSHVIRNQNTNEEQN